MLESCKPLSRFLRKWGRLRREKPNRSKVVVIHPRYSVTASKSDEWVPILRGRTQPWPWPSPMSSSVKSSMTRPSSSTGQRVRSLPEMGAESIQPERKYRKSRRFQQRPLSESPENSPRTKPAIAIGGKESINRPDGTYASYAIFCLNALVGSIDAQGGVMYQDETEYQKMPPLAEDGIAETAGRSRVLIFGERISFLLPGW